MDLYLPVQLFAMATPLSTLPKGAELSVAVQSIGTIANVSSNQMQVHPQLIGMPSAVLRSDEWQMLFPSLHGNSKY
jgi:hypothetical protein